MSTSGNPFEWVVLGSFSPSLLLCRFWERQRSQVIKVSERRTGCFAFAGVQAPSIGRTDLLNLCMALPSCIDTILSIPREHLTADFVAVMNLVFSVA